MARAFVGSLCRYYAAVDAGGRDAAALAPGVVAWRQDLVAGLADAVQQALDWPEDPDRPGEWFDLGDSGWLALRLFAFYAERSELELPDTVPALLELDRDYRGAMDAGFGKSLYGQLLPCSVWLPAEFPLTLNAPLPDGEAAEVGSLFVLQDQLRWLNQRTFQADQDVVAGWRELPAPPGAPLLEAAQRGFAALSAAAAAARAAGVPLVAREV